MRNIESPAKSKMAARGSKDGGRGQKRGPILAIARLFGARSPRTPFMRNVDPPAKSKMAVRGPQNGRRGLERGPILGYWALRSTFAK